MNLGIACKTFNLEKNGILFPTLLPQQVFQLESEIPRRHPTVM